MTFNDIIDPAVLLHPEAFLSPLEIDNAVARALEEISAAPAMSRRLRPFR
jgi:hypothetical protein